MMRPVLRSDRPRDQAPAWSRVFSRLCFECQLSKRSFEKVRSQAELGNEENEGNGDGLIGSGYPRRVPSTLTPLPMSRLCS
jgi:hypothetical protein